MPSRSKLVILVAPVVAAALVLPADAATVALPQSLTGGGPGGSSWGPFDNDGSYCQDDSGFNLEEAELDPGDSTPVGEQDDAFDDAWLLSNTAGGSGGSYFNSPGDEVDLTGQTITSGTFEFGDYDITVTHTAFPDAARLRTIYTFENVTDNDLVDDYQIETDLGSDEDTRIGTSSSGDATWTPEDRWVTTWEFTDSPPPSDPVITTVMHGSGAVQVPDLVSFACTTVDPVPNPDGPDDGELMRSVWTIAIPAFETRHLVFFTDLSQTTDEAAAAATVYDPIPSPDSPLFAGIPADQLPNILNWQFGTEPEPTTTTTAAPTTTTTAAARPAVVTPRFTG